MKNFIFPLFVLTNLENDYNLMGKHHWSGCSFAGAHAYSTGMIGSWTKKTLPATFKSMK